MRKIFLMLAFTFIAVNISIVNANDATTNKDDGVEKKEVEEIEKKVHEILQKSKDNWYYKEEYADELAKLGEKAVPILLKELNNEFSVIIITSACAMVKINGDKYLPEIVKAYAKMLRKFKPHEFSDLIEKFGNKAIPYLKSELSANETKCRYELITTIVDIDTNESKKTLVEWYPNENSLNNKLTIIKFVYNFDSVNKDKYKKLVYSHLDNEIIEVRCLVIEILGEIKDESKVKLLIKFADDKNLEVKSSVFWSLCQIGNEEGINVVKSFLNDENKYVRTSALLSLRSIRPDDSKLNKIVVAALITALDDKVAYIRYLSIRGLSFFDDLSIIPHLDKIAENDPEEKNRNEAKRATEMIIRNRKFNWKYKKAETDDSFDEIDENDYKIENEEIHKKVMSILEKAKEEDFDEDEIVNEIIRFGRQAIPTLLKQLYNSNSEIVCVSASILDLICGRQALKPILRAYLKQSDDLFLFKIEMLIEEYKEKALPYLINEIKSDDSEIRYKVIEFIGRIETSKSIEFLKKWFKKEISWKNNLKIVEYVYEEDESNRNEYLEFIHNLLNEDDIEIMCEAIKTLGTIRDSSKLDFLIKLTNHENKRVKRLVFTTLCKIGNKEGVEVVLKFTKNVDPDLRKYAVHGLEYVDSEDKELQKKVISSLIGTLSDPDRLVRFQCIYSLSSFKDLEIIPHLTKISVSDPNKMNRSAALKAIERIKRNKEEYDESHKDDDKENDEVEEK